MCMPIIAFADAYDAKNYMPVNASVQIEETNLPIVFINTKATDGNTTVIHKDYRVAVRMTIINNDEGKNYGDTLVHPGQKVDYDGWVGIKYRGESSFNFARKKPMGFRTLETSDINGKKKKVKILGMPKDNDWVLLAPYHDRSMIRDVLSFELARPYFEYTPRARHCEVIMDDVYRGVYILCEKPGKGKNRLNLENPGDEDDALTGDFLLQVDSDEEKHYTSKYRTRDSQGKDMIFNSRVYYQYKFPKYDDMVPDHSGQLNYINKQISDFEDMMNSQDYANPETGYRHYIDVTSFVDYTLSQEFSSNPDAYRRSIHLYKRRNDVSPCFKTCLWDFNMAYGNSLEELGETTNKWHYLNDASTEIFRVSHVPFWWARIIEDAYYVDCLKKRWREYRETNYREERITQVIDSLVNLLEVGGARERNYKAWPNWNEYIFLDRNETKNYDEEISFIRSWIINRLSWMDQQLEFVTEADYVLSPKGEEYSKWYDLHGRLIKGTPVKKGLYIHGGKKVLLR